MARDFNTQLAEPQQHGTPAPSKPGYSRRAKFMHWLIALVVLSQFVVATLMPGIKATTVASPLINLHFSLGVLIFVLMVIRGFFRLLHPVPLNLPGSPAWERSLALGTHRAFYVILLIGPFLGWASASAHNLSVSVFGLFVLPSLAAPKARWALIAGDAHSLFMWILLALIGLHVAGALYHYFFRRDQVLQRMLPTRCK